MISSSGLQYQIPRGPLLAFPDLALPQRGVLLLTGPSGCGKSTWLALAAALVAPTAGALQVAGQALAGLGRVQADAWRARTIGLLPQKLHLSAALTVRENLALAGWAAGQSLAPARLMQVLDALGLADLAGRLPAQLSGGQAQRVALARAVMLQPQVLLADEPTASLDDEAASAAIALLLQVAQTHGASLVIATHDARVAGLIPPGASGAPGFSQLRLLRLAPFAADPGVPA